MKILIAEDDNTSRKLLDALLKKWDYEVVSTSNGDEAWAALQAKDAPRLAILDWMMPGKDGAEICRNVRQLEDHNPTYIILLTALGRKEDIVSGLAAGADDYVTKPFDNRELEARVRVGKRVVELQTALADRIQELQEALAQVKTLQGIIPICMHCHKIRTDQEAWQQIEEYVQNHSAAQFSHSICPDCMAKYHPKTRAGT